MSTSDTPDIDEKKETISTVKNNFNVSGFLNNVITRIVYMLIYIFMSVLVLYGTKIYGRDLPNKSNKSNYWQQFIYQSSSTNKTITEPVFENFKISFLEPERISTIKVTDFMEKQMIDTYNYTMDALIFLFNFLYNLNSDTLIAIIGPILLAVLVVLLFMFGFVCFIYYYISNLFYNFNLKTNPFISCILVIFFIILLFIYNTLN